jgi:hypothetical protein
VGFQEFGTPGQLPQDSVGGRGLDPVTGGLVFLGAEGARDGGQGRAPVGDEDARCRGLAAGRHDRGDFDAPLDLVSP